MQGTEAAFEKEFDVVKNPPPGLTKRSAVAVAGFALALSVGCGRLPVSPAPAGPGAYSSPTFAVVPAGAGIFGATGAGPLTGSLFIDGAVGGSLTVGRFTVIVPAGAFKDTATVAIEIPDPSIVECNLSITPASANGFAIPVTLTADCSGATNVNLANCGTLWFDPQSGLWRTVGGASVDLVHNTVSGALPHFSTYGIADLTGGKAGW